MFLLSTVIGCIIVMIIAYKNNKDTYLRDTAIFAVISIITSMTIYGITIFSKTHATEVWSGKIVSVDHIEEYDELVTDTNTDSKGNTYTTTRIVHHNAENYIKTSDNGSISVNESLDRKIHFNDSFPNNKEELEKFYPVGTPTSSVHSYINKVQASYSIYKHKEIDLKQYKDLPKYPIEPKNPIQIDRFIGDINNKEVILDKLNEINTELNSKKNNKQVNLIFVNLGNKSEDYGFALQDYWTGGNKNDFVVCFGSDSDKVTWVYPFSWADSDKSEKLKIDVRNYMLNIDLSEDFSIHLDKVSNMVKENFERKQFAEFNYLKTELSTWSYIAIIISNIIIAFLVLVLTEEKRRYKYNRW